MRVIQTEFDNPLEEDVQLEPIGGKKPPVAEVLANAENIYKSFLYFRKMFSEYPQKEQTASVGTINTSSYTSITLAHGVNRVIVKNIGGDTGWLRLNGNEYAILPGEREEIPVRAPTDDAAGDTVELKGNISYLLKIVQEF